MPHGSKDPHDPYVSVSNKASDWKVFRSKLVPGGDASLWDEAYETYFMGRLKHRYFKPIEILQRSGSYKGEGFSIVAIQCTLIEFLESTVQGRNYQYKNAGQFEYSKSGELFVAFLSTRLPFSSGFSAVLAQDFYENVRCPLLHEARTKNGWTIWGRSLTGSIVNATEKVVYRNNFQEAFLHFVRDYKSRLLSEPKLQEAFVRKFESICT